MKSIVIPTIPGGHIGISPDHRNPNIIPGRMKKIHKTKIVNEAFFIASFLARAEMDPIRPKKQPRNILLQRQNTTDRPVWNPSIARKYLQPVGGRTSFYWILELHNKCHGYNMLYSTSR